MLKRKRNAAERKAAEQFHGSRQVDGTAMGVLGVDGHQPDALGLELVRELP